MKDNSAKRREGYLDAGDVTEAGTYVTAYYIYHWSPRAVTLRQGTDLESTTHWTKREGTGSVIVELPPGMRVFRMPPDVEAKLPELAGPRSANDNLKVTTRNGDTLDIDAGHDAGHVVLGVKTGNLDEIAPGESDISLAPEDLDKLGEWFERRQKGTPAP